MEDPSGLTLTIIAGTSFCVSALCSLAKSAQLDFSETKLEAMLGTAGAGKKVSKFMSRSSQILIALTIFGAFANIAFLLAIILFFSKNGSISNIDLCYGITLAFCPFLVLAKVIPETVARLQPERIMMWGIPFSSMVYWLLWPLVWPIHWLTEVCEKFLGKGDYASLATAIEKEILQVVTEGQKEGLLQETEKDMITGIMDLKDGEVREIMTPRTDMFCIAIDTPMTEAISLANEKGHSRIPVYRENRDDIVGTLYIKDVLKYWDAENRTNLKVEELMRKPFFIPETKHIGKLLQEFQTQKLHMAIVLDEYGGTAGIVTIEDIIEEIVGEILDEYDFEAYESVRRLEENVLEVDARIHVDELNEELETELPVDDGYETLGGFLFSYLGHIPKKNESCRYRNIEFVVLEASERRISRVKVVKNSDSS